MTLCDRSFWWWYRVWGWWIENCVCEDVSGSEGAEGDGRIGWKRFDRKREGERRNGAIVCVREP